MRSMKKILTAVLMLAMTASLLAGCGSGNSGSTSASAASSAASEAEGGERTVNLAIQPSCAFVPLVIARESGWIEEAMAEIGVNVVWTDFESGPPMNESFAAGQQDIGVIGDVPSVSAIAAGQENVFIAACEGGPSYGMVVMEDSGIESVADLKGKKVGLTLGSTAQNLAEKLLANAGLDFASDVEVINVSTGDAQTVLLNHDVDAVVTWEPNVSRLDAMDEIRLLTDGGDIGFPGMNVVFARKAFVDENPDIVKVYLEQYWRATKAFAEDPDAYLELLSGYFTLDAELVGAAAAKYNYVLKFEDEDVAGLQDTIAFLVRIGTIAEEYDVAEHIDDSIARAVLEEAGE